MTVSFNADAGYQYINISDDSGRDEPAPSTSSNAQSGPSFPRAMSPLTTEHQKTYQVFLKYFSKDDEASEFFLKHFFQTIMSRQINLTAEKVHQLFETYGFEQQVLIFKDCFAILEKNPKSGVESRVYKARFFATEKTQLGDQILSPGDFPSQYAVKIGKNSNIRYTPQHDKICTIFSPRKRQYYDVALKLGRTQDDLGVAVHKLAESDFKQIDYLAFKNVLNLHDPVGGIIDMFCQVLGELAHLHEKGEVHRDIKASNLLIGDTPNDSWMTDLSLACQAFYEPQKGAKGCSAYLNPSSFDFNGNFLINLENTMGVQRPCDDMYAMALTLLDCISQMISQMRNEKNSFMGYEKQIFPQTGLAFRDDELEDIQKRYNLPLYLSETVDDERAKNKRDLVGTMDQVAFIRMSKLGQPDQVLILPTMKEREQKLLFGIENIEKMVEEDKNVLRKMVELCMEMIRSHDQNRLTALEMREKLDHLKIPTPDPSTKRSLFLDDEERPSKRKAV